MASAHAQAKEAAGEAGTLAYLRCYRDEYQKAVTKNPMRGGDEYLASLDAAIKRWDLGEVPDLSDILVPGMIKRPTKPAE